MRLTALILTLGLLCPRALLAADPAGYLIIPIVKLGMPVEPHAVAAWPFYCVDGDPYFEVSRKRTVEDQPVRWPWKSIEHCSYFEASGLKFDDIEKKLDAGDTTLKNIGAGSFNETFTKFRPAPGIPAELTPPVGYLTVDYSTKPPLVKLTNAPDKFSKWQIRHGEQAGEWFIGSMDESGKIGWLSMGDKPKVVIDGPPDSLSVEEFRRAIISYESKPSYRIDVQNDGP